MNNIDNTNLYHQQDASNNTTNSHWYHLSLKAEDLDDEFLMANADKLNWNLISYRRKVTNMALLKYVKLWGNWLYYDDNRKKQIISEHYKIKKYMGKDHVVCYKAVRNNLSSIRNPELFTYDRLYHVYETRCDYNENVEHSFGFGCWNKGFAEKYAEETETEDYRIIQCLVPLDSICVLGDCNGKIRAGKMIVESFGLWG